MSILKIPRKILTMLYEDRLEIQRKVKTKTPYGETIETYETVEADIPCKYSYKSFDNPKGETTGANARSETQTVFMGVDVDVLKGDYLTVGRLIDNVLTMVVVKGVAAQPRKYQSHIEVDLEFKGNA
jgi:hypothetical protein